ncbi:MAG: S16 family serine protease [Anaerolineae bacterium]
MLTKRFGLKLHEQDIFVNVVGGENRRTGEQHGDGDGDGVELLQPLHNDMTFIGEIGLAGELRPVAQLSARLFEASKMGFKRLAMIPKMKKRLPDIPEGIKLVRRATSVKRWRSPCRRN